jgi:hypothetical protein
VSSASANVDVKLLQGGGGNGQFFYFKMENAQSKITPCFTIAVFADTEAHAQALAEAQNGGYTATSIDAGEFSTACQ